MGWKDKETVSVASVSWCHFFNGPWPQGAISAPGTRAKKKFCEYDLVIISLDPFFILVMETC